MVDGAHHLSFTISAIARQIPVFSSSIVASFVS